MNTPSSYDPTFLSRARQDDRRITRVACTCGRHMYGWQDKSWLAREASGDLVPVQVERVPDKCRQSFVSRDVS